MKLIREEQTITQQVTKQWQEVKFQKQEVRWVFQNKAGNNDKLNDIQQRNHNLGSEPFIIERVQQIVTVNWSTDHPLLPHCFLLHY